MMLILVAILILQSMIRQATSSEETPNDALVEPLQEHPTCLATTSASSTQGITTPAADPWPHNAAVMVSIPLSGGPMILKAKAKKNETVIHRMNQASYPHCAFSFIDLSCVQNQKLCLRVLRVQRLCPARRAACAFYKPPGTGPLCWLRHMSNFPPTLNICTRSACGRFPK
jgi:hypothetical protein